jgi:hypothetical protein
MPLQNISNASLQLFMNFKEYMLAFLERLEPYSVVLSLLLMTGVAYCFFRIEQIVRDTYHSDTARARGHGRKGRKGEELPEPGLAEKRFERILIRLDSEKESDWRLAVLEADVLLDEMVTHMGYHGDSLGERLRSIEKSDFVTLDKAWEAHAVRNRIAHEGAAFPLASREAKRVIGLYEEVFREFHFI